MPLLDRHVFRPLAAAASTPSTSRPPACRSERRFPCRLPSIRAGIFWGANRNRASARSIAQKPAWPRAMFAWPTKARYPNRPRRNARWRRGSAPLWLSGPCRGWIRQLNSANWALLRHSFQYIIADGPVSPVFSPLVYTVRQEIVKPRRWGYANCASNVVAGT